MQNELHRKPVRTNNKRFTYKFYSDCNILYYSEKREKRRPGSFQKSRKILINLGKESVRKDG